MRVGPPEILSVQTQHLIVRGQPYVITCEATGAPSLQVYWKKNNNTLLNDTSVTVSYQ